MYCFGKKWDSEDFGLAREKLLYMKSQNLTFFYGNFDLIYKTNYD